jgi:hypothetical protein
LTVWLRALGRSWDRYWFQPASASNLGFCRFLFVGLMFWLYRHATFEAFARVPEVFLFPHGYFAQFEVPIASAEVLGPMTLLWKASLVLGALGLFTRASLLLALVLSIYLLGLPHNFGKVNHADAVVVLVLLTLALSRCADAWSVDRLVRRFRFGRAPERDRPEPSGRYGWPIRTVWLIVSLIFASAGVAKLRGAGLAWMHPENLTTILVQHQYYYGGMAPTRWGLTIGQHPAVVVLLATGTLLIELGMISAMFSPRARAVLVPAAIMMLGGFSRLLGVTFTALAVAFLFFVPWDRAGTWVLTHAWSAGRGHARGP